MGSWYDVVDEKAWWLRSSLTVVSGRFHVIMVCMRYHHEYPPLPPIPLIPRWKNACSCGTETWSAPTWSTTTPWRVWRSTMPRHDDTTTRCRRDIFRNISTSTRAKEGLWLRKQRSFFMDRDSDLSAYFFFVWRLACLVLMVDVLHSMVVGVFRRPMVGLLAPFQRAVLVDYNKHFYVLTVHNSV